MPRLGATGYRRLNGHLPRSAELSVAGLVLAAGGGRRYGGPKALVRLDGQSLVERAVATARDAGCAPIVVVLGPSGADVRAATELGEVTVVDNPSWKTGVSSSLKAGLAALADIDVDSAAVLLVDTPGVSVEAVRRVTAKAGRDALAAAGYGARRGHPVLLGRDHWAGIEMLAVGDVGVRPYLTARAAEVQTVACDDVADDAEMEFPEPPDEQ